MRALTRLLVVCAATLVVHADQAAFSTNGAHTQPVLLTPELKKLVQEVVNNETIPGLSLAVVHSGGIADFATWGHKTEDGDEMTSDTIFDMASCSKAFLASSLGILMDDFARGRNNTPLPSGITRFDWHSRVSDILPEDWKLMDDWASTKATFRDILSHQSGMPSHDVAIRATDTAQDLVRRMRFLRPAFELRQKFSYNNQMYVLGTYVIAKYSGMSYMEFVKERIFTPLNMSSSTFFVEEASRDGRMTQSWSSFGRRIPIWMPDDRVQINIGMSGVKSSTVDLVNWVRMWLNQGVSPLTNQTVIPKLTYETITSAQSIMEPAPAPEFSIRGYGAGWGRYSYQGHEIVMHTGGIWGFSTYVLFLPNDGLGIVTLVNANDKDDSALVPVYRIIEDYLGLERKHSSRLLARLRQQHEVVEDCGVQDAQEHASALSSPTLSLEAYAGVYAGPGFPSITLCAPTSSSPECADTLEQFSHFENVAASETLYAIIPTVWVSHGRVTHRDGNRFALVATTPFPHGFGKNQTAFEVRKVDVDISVEFVPDDRDDSGVGVHGFALNGLVGAVTERARIGGTVEGTAEVYFRKIS